LLLDDWQRSLAGRRRLLHTPGHHGIAHRASKNVHVCVRPMRAPVCREGRKDFAPSLVASVADETTLLAQRLVQLLHHLAQLAPCAALVAVA
jgi:hypothetical protein